MWRNHWRWWLKVNRALIDVVDVVMLWLLRWRMVFCRRIGRVKRRHGLPIYVPEREQQVLKQRAAIGRRFEFEDTFIITLATAIMTESKRLQKGEVKWTPQSS